MLNLSANHHCNPTIKESIFQVGRKWKMLAQPELLQLVCRVCEYTFIFNCS